MLQYILLVAGFVLLIGGAEYLVRGASSIARLLNVSDLIIGLTVVSLGTSAPELVVNIMASVSGSSGMAIGNVIGSNIFNFFVIIGLTALVAPIKLKNSLIKIEIPFAIVASFALIFVAGDSLFDGNPGMIDRGDGLTLLLFFSIFLYYIYLSAKKKEIPEQDVVDEQTKSYPVWLSLVMLAGGIAALMFGGELIVGSATEIAIKWGMSETVIGLTIVAVGTSLPELATSAVAAFRGNSDIAIGNVVGSNIFNIFLILGISSVILPLPFDPQSMHDAYIAALGTAMVLIFGLTGKKRLIDRKEGAILIITYVGYIVYLFYR